MLGSTRAVWSIGSSLIQTPVRGREWQIGHPIQMAITDWRPARPLSTAVAACGYGPELCTRAAGRTDLAPTAHRAHLLLARHTRAQLLPHPATPVEAKVQRSSHARSPRVLNDD